MELQIPCSILFTFFCFLLMIYKLSTSLKPTKTSPPAPWKLPLIGNLHQLAGSLPHRSLRDLANKYGPIMQLQLGQISNVVISSPELATEIMKTHDQIFANRPRILAAEVLVYNCKDIAFSPYGNHWRQLRKICMLELLSAKRVQSFRTIREDEASTLVKNISEEHAGSVMDLGKKILPITNSIVARAAFGKRTKNVEEILSNLAFGIQLASGLSISDLFPSLKILRVITGTEAKVKKVHTVIDRMLDNIINDHKEKNQSHTNNGEPKEEDLVDVLLRIQKENNLEIPLTLDNIKGVILDIFVGGTETAATTVEWAMSELLRDQKRMKKAQEEVRRVYGDKGYVDESKLDHLNYLGAIIKETLRIHPPLPLLVPRENSQGCEIHGYEIPHKTKVMVNVWAIGRDPKYWKEPEKFQPERFMNSSIDYRGTNFEYIPFGAGRRICPGVTFASVVIELVLANLLYHFDWKLPNDMKREEIDMTESFGATVRRKNGLCVVPVNYHS
ncbi:cytochrome P450 71D10-like [Prosopis cineraria]|uniref:cytochrome P450 71D10-like n=1 Tax=Prosopis cineraria TaxID=364024 RepID=UPI00240FA46D|nr:cytochrome P450 71D10-like [Prosopis cineraria]